MHPITCSPDEDLADVTERMRENESNTCLSPRRER
jgi:hypothetical protein